MDRTDDEQAVLRAAYAHQQRARWCERRPQKEEEAMTQAGDASSHYDRATEFRHEEQHLEGVVASIDNAIEERETRGPVYAADRVTTKGLKHLRSVQLQQLQSARNRPYFGRIDIADESGGVETIYIGDVHVRNDDPRYMIASPNAPIARLYFRPRDGFYEVDGTQRPALVQLKRLLVIGDATLLDFDDVLRLRSRILDEKLAAPGGRELADAVQTIQPHQYEQIASTQKPVLIVQGAAGSGKSFIGLRRIAFILSEHSDIGSMRRPKAERVIMYGPSPAFLKYVSGLLPGLGIERVKQTTTTKWMLSKFSARVTLSRQDRIFDDLMNNRRKLTAAEKDAHQFKSGLGMKRLIDNYVDHLRREIRGRVNRAGGIRITGHADGTSIASTASRFRRRVAGALNYVGREVRERVNLSGGVRVPRRSGDVPLVLSASALKRRVAEALRAHREPNAARSRLVATLAREWARANSRRSVSQLELEMEGRRLAESHLDSFWKKMDFRSEYTTLVASPEKIMVYSRRRDVDPSMADEIVKTAPPGAGQALGITDLAAALYLDYALNGFTSERFEHIVIDEAQDVSALEMELLKMHSETKTFTILGDLRQSVLPYKSISNWNQIASLFPREDVSRLDSRWTYRSTKQITQYANRILRQLPERTKMPIPYERGGDRPRLVRSQSAAEMRRAITDSVRELTRREDIQTVAVLTKWQKTADDIGKALTDAGIEPVGALTSEGVIEADVTVSPIVLTKGLEFDAVIVANAHKDNFKESDFDRMLFYLACTRARHHLEVHWYGTRSSIVPGVGRLAGSGASTSRGSLRQG